MARTISNKERSYLLENGMLARRLARAARRRRNGFSDTSRRRRRGFTVKEEVK